MDNMKERGTVEKSTVSSPTPQPDRPMWFVYDDDEGFAFFSSPESARLEAEKRLQAYRDEAVEGWSDETDSVRWGLVYQEARETIRISRAEWEKTHDPEEESFPGGYGFDEYADYSLMPVLLRGGKEQTHE